MFTLAHLSDPHLALPPVPGPASLMNKRILGYLSWRRRRRFIHDPRVLQALVADLHEQRPTHVAITGDLVNISLPEEFSRAASWLRALGAPDWITVIPGNHDAYLPMPWRESLGLWADYMTDEGGGGAAKAPGGRDDFPIVRRRGPVALIGLNSAHPSKPFMAFGTLGERQLAALDARLTALGREGLFRVVLVHHPPLNSQSRRGSRLVDAPGLRDVIARAGAELVLYGHIHRFSLEHTAGAGGRVPVVSVPSA
ncbi:MAG: metallophosphoesterase, partial [Alphaproteobacteria bacterium]